MSGCRALTEDEVNRTMEALSGRNCLRDRALLMVGIATGFRACELLSMRLGDVVRDGQIQEEVTVLRRFMKGARPTAQTLERQETPRQGDESLASQIAEELLKRGVVAQTRQSTCRRKVRSRTMWVNPTARHHLRLWIDELRCNRGYFAADCWLWQSGRGINSPIGVRQLWRILVGAFRRAGIGGRVGTHTLRKTFTARVGLKLGGDITLIQEALGHASLTSTRSYVDVNRELIRRAVLEA